MKAKWSQSGLWLGLPSVSSEKSFNNGEAIKLTVADVKFSKMFESSDFIIGSKYFQLFSLRKQTHFVHF